MRFNIQYKIAVIFALITAVVLLGVFVYLNGHLREHTYQRIRANLHKETSLAKTFLEESKGLNFKSYELDDMADKISKDLGIRVTIIGLEGTVWGDSDLDGARLHDVEDHLYRPEVQQALKSQYGESRRFSTTVKKDMLYIANVFGPEETMGIIRLSIPLSEIEMITDNLKKMLIVSLFVAFALSIVIGFIAAVFVSRPLREMSEAAKNIAKGDFTKRLSVMTHDEIADLANAFNYMSEQIRARIEEVIANKSRLETVLLSMFEGVMVTDANGTIILMNKTLKDFFYIKDESLGKKPIEVVRNVEIQEVVDDTLEKATGVTSREVTLLLPEEKILLVHATPVKRQEETEGAVLVFHDITELRRLEKIRKDFVANVSHELRTPVSNIKGYAETLLEGALGDKDNAKDFVKIIHSDSDRLARLIDDLLDLSGLESAKMKLALKPCSLDSVARKIISRFEKPIKDRSIAIEIDIPKDLADILADELALAQVLLNLIDNAIKYNKEGGAIAISAQEKDNFIHVDVSDTGIGIPEKDLPRVFERFYRVDKARSRELGGTGLGLSIVKHLIQALGGDISVKSVFGKGSTFTFTVPKA